MVELAEQVVEIQPEPQPEYLTRDALIEILEKYRESLTPPPQQTANINDVSMNAVRNITFNAPEPPKTPEMISDQFTKRFMSKYNLKAK